MEAQGLGSVHVRLGREQGQLWWLCEDSGLLLPRPAPPGLGVWSVQPSTLPSPLPTAPLAAFPFPGCNSAHVHFGLQFCSRAWWLESRSCMAEGPGRGTVLIPWRLGSFEGGGSTYHLHQFPLPNSSLSLSLSMMNPWKCTAPMTQAHSVGAWGELQLSPPHHSCPHPLHLDTTCSRLQVTVLLPLC